LFVNYLCPSCGRRYALNEKIFRCSCGEFFVSRNKGIFPCEELSSRDLTIWRYREAYGLPEGIEPVSLGEGFTPVIERKVQGRRVLFKLDFMRPSGSFKDRGPVCSCP